MNTSLAEAPTTVGAWLEALSPAPPEPLAARLADSLGAHRGRPIAELPLACLDAGGQLLAQLLAAGDTSRDAALDLLAIDALITYAFESAAGSPETLDRLAALAMQRIASMPAPASDGST